MGLNFAYIIITLIAISVLVIGFLVLKDFSRKNNELDIINFENSLKTSLEKQSLDSFGSVAEKTFAVPSNTEKVCFVDENKNFNELVDGDLNKAMEKYGDYNLFINPIEAYMPVKIAYLALNENPLCVKAVNGKIKLRLESIGNSTLVSAANLGDKEVECVTLSYNDEPENSEDVVFLGSSYKDADSFSSDVNRYVQKFSAVKPFSDKLDKINFYRIDNFKGIGCKVVPYGIGSYVICDDYLVEQLASECPIDHIVVLVKIGAVTNLVRGTRSSAKGIIATINSGDDALLLMHEFGHTFAKLADEYTDNNVKNFDQESYANCDTKGCDKWNDVEGVGCYQGCTYNGYSCCYRPTMDSIMNSLSTDDYGPVNQKEITNKLDVYQR